VVVAGRLRRQLVAAEEQERYPRSKASNARKSHVVPPFFAQTFSVARSSRHL
jgi:hypothetical protein